MNIEKTEFIKLSRNNNNNITNRKLGNKISNVIDINNRKILSSIAFKNLFEIWKNKNKIIKLETKLKLYRIYIKSILEYNISCLTLTKVELEKLNAYHRKQLRILCNIYYPNKISNDKLYEKTKEVPISIDIIKRRWSLFGHILRQNNDIPANKIMLQYFRMSEDKQISSDQRYIRTSIVKFLNKDLSILRNDEKQIIIKNINNIQKYKFKLENVKDLNYLKEIAEERKCWIYMMKAITITSILSYFNEHKEKIEKRKKKITEKMLQYNNNNKRNKIDIGNIIRNYIDKHYNEQHQDTEVRNIIKELELININDKREL